MTIPYAQSCNVCFNSWSYCSFLCTFLYLLFPKLAINITVISVISLASSEEGPSPIFGVLMSYDVNKQSSVLQSETASLTNLVVSDLVPCASSRPSRARPANI
jgi:hypothetical protein